MQAQGIASVISSTQEEPVREIAQGILLGTQFQHFIPEVAVPDTTMDEQGSSPHHADVHLEKVDLTRPDYGAGSSILIGCWIITVSITSPIRASCDGLLLS